MAERTRTWRRTLLHVGGALLAVFVAMQLIPYGWTHSNPPVSADAPWPSAEAEAIARESCYSCHSNETDWPAYSYVAPASWLVRRDVDEGRSKLNFSTWGQGDDDADEAAEEVEEGAMPPSKYTLMHPGAKLTDEEARILVDALEAMTGDRGDDHSGSGRGGDDEGYDD